MDKYNTLCQRHIERPYRMYGSMKVKVIHKERQLLYTWKQLTSLWEYVQRDKYVTQSKLRIWCNESNWLPSLHQLKENFRSFATFFVTSPTKRPKTNLANFFIMMTRRMWSLWTWLRHDARGLLPCFWRWTFSNYCNMGIGEPCCPHSFNNPKSSLGFGLCTTSLLVWAYL